MAQWQTVMIDYIINYVKRAKNPRSGIIKSNGKNFFTDVDPQCQRPLHKSDYFPYPPV